MSVVATEVRFTPEDLVEMPDTVQFELDDGQLVESNLSALSSLVAMQLGRRIGNFSEEKSLGNVFGPDCSYQCFPGPR